MSAEIKELNAEIDRLKREIELKNGWISLLSHDFREVFGNLSFLTEGAINGSISQEDFFKLLPRIAQDAKKNLQTVTDTSQWIKTQVDGFRPQIAEISVKGLFLQLQKEFEEYLAEKNIAFELKGEGNLSFNGDSFLVFFMLKKILNNAIKFSHPGKPIYFGATKENGKLVLSVTDFGIGMDAMTQDTIFTFEGPKFQGTNGEVGAGLSLKIVREFVLLMQGEVKVDSTEEVGTKVTITIPEINL
ncbi:MAG: HAMP domain-containing sensor histidine kinase [Arenibacter sp.]|nr:HAMP domain-containing sensor histidine kinase [Arenibacter sp.]